MILLEKTKEYITFNLIFIHLMYFFNEHIAKLLAKDIPIIRHLQNKFSSDQNQRIFFYIFVTDVCLLFGMKLTIVEDLQPVRRLSVSMRQYHIVLMMVFE